MIISKVTRSYSRSLNTKNYGLPESWIKIEATYEAECESGDDAVKVSELLVNQAQNDVVKGIQEIIEKINASKAPAPVTPVAPAPVAPVAPVAPLTPPTVPFTPPVAPVATPRAL